MRVRLLNLGWFMAWTVQFLNAEDLLWISKPHDRVLDMDTSDLCWSMFAE
jgi:hypothetical protein